MNPIEYENPEVKIKQLEEEIETLKRRIISQEKLKKDLSINPKVANRVLLSESMARDINDILESISNTIQPVLSEKAENDPDYQAIAKIGSLVKRGSRLIEQFMSLSQTIGSNYAPVDLNSIIREINMFLQKTISKRTNIDLDLDEDLKMVGADEGQIGQVLMYLGLNAGDAMPAEGTLTLRTENVSLKEGSVELSSNIPPGDYVLLTVSDTGCGMPPQTLEHIFDPNYISKTKNAETSERLSMVYAIVKSHGGYIDCSSRLGEGTTFKVHLPVSVSMVENPSISASERCQKPPSETVNGSETILMVDDEPEILNAGKKYMQRFGYRVITAKNGREAINKYKKYPIHLVVLDVGLPDMNGLSCFKTLRSINQNANIVISTGSYLNPDKKELSDLGAAAFLPKPYSLSQLLNTAKRILYGQSL